MPLRLAAAILLAAAAALAQAPPSFTLAGDWDVLVSVSGVNPQTVRVAPVALLSVTAERYDDLPLFNPKAGGWVRGAQLKGVKAQETTSPFLVDVPSFTLRAGPEPGSTLFIKDTDYTIDPDWGTFGRLPNGRIQPGQPVFATYRHAQTRLDAIVLSPNGRISIQQGEPRAAAPAVPPLEPGNRHLGNIYLPGLLPRLSNDNFFPILEQSFPEQVLPLSPTIQRLTHRLNAGHSIRILAWGDSVTDGVYLPNKNTQRWQEQFVARLRARFPKARIELLTEAWGGRNTGSYLAVPPGNPHNYRETVLALKPDLVVSEFVNDAGLKPHQVQERYASLLTDFRSIGAEWIILTPHYVRPDWMNLASQRDIDDDPRPYVAGLRQFAASHDVALADASLRYGRLWRQGIPYNALMLNAINHPDARGMRLFADALMALFP